MTEIVSERQSGRTGVMGREKARGRSGLKTDRCRMSSRWGAKCRVSRDGERNVRNYNGKSDRELDRRGTERF